MINTPEQYTNYFRQLQEQHKQINSFHRVTFTGDLQTDMFVLSEFLTKQHSLLSPCLLRVLFHGDIIDNNSENRLQNTKGTFILLDRVDDTGNFDLIENCYERMYNVALQFIARMKKDWKENYMGSADIQFQDFDIDFVGPVIGKYHGCMVNFSYLVNLNPLLKYDATQWNETL